MKVHHIAIVVDDLDESLKFYCAYFNFKIVKKFERKDLKGKAAFIQLSDFYLELWQFEDVKDNKDNLSELKIKGIRHIAFQVDNTDKTVSELREKGLTISDSKMGASGHKYRFTTDPNGIALELYEK